MPKSENQKLKLLYLLEILYKYTDENHGLTTAEIINHMSSYGIRVERKTVYGDLECLIDYGVDICRDIVHGNHIYYVASRDFEVAELKLLVDAVQASKFISEKTSSQVIEKLEQLVSTYQAGKLKRQTFVQGRVKSEKTTSLYAIDTLHEAISENLCVEFNYMRWNVNKELVDRNDGNTCLVAPYSLIWNNEYYYLVAYEYASDKIKHYRVDKIANVEKLDNVAFDRNIFKNVNLTEYTNKMFGMFNGEEKTVIIEGDNSMVGIFIDRFGKHTPIIPLADNRFRVIITAVISENFLGWIIGLGDKIEITAPDEIRSELKNIGNRLTDIYK